MNPLHLPSIRLVVICSIGLLGLGANTALAQDSAAVSPPRAAPPSILAPPIEPPVAAAQRRRAAQGRRTAQRGRAGQPRRDRQRRLRQPEQRRAAPASTAAPATSTLTPDQLDALVAPIALYPDDLLAQTLVASTYPLEIVQLQQWLIKNPKLKDKALVDSVAKQPWDPAIQSMAAVPEVVKRLADDIQWSTDLGNAFLAQQADVMDACQRMRKKAQGERRPQVQ